MANQSPTSANNKGRPAPNLTEIKARLTQIRGRHAQFYDSGRHICSECEICWFIKTIDDLVAEVEKKRITPNAVS